MKHMLLGSVSHLPLYILIQERLKERYGDKYVYKPIWRTKWIVI